MEARRRRADGAERGSRKHSAFRETERVKMREEAQMRFRTAPENREQDFQMVFENERFQTRTKMSNLEDMLNKLCQHIASRSELRATGKTVASGTHACASFPPLESRR